MKTLGKDCDCITHDGPHWLHMDRLWYEKNRELLREAEILAKAGKHYGAILAMRAFCENEAARLREKEYQMRRLGLTELPKGGGYL